jgi:hypothetical protein
MIGGCYFAALSAGHRAAIGRRGRALGSLGRLLGYLVRRLGLLQGLICRALRMIDVGLACACRQCECTGRDRSAFAPS